MAPAAPAFFPIRNLTGYQPHWTICARVTNKSATRTFNSKGSGAPGKVFSVDLLDKEGGEIRASFFNQAADSYLEKLQQGKVYSFSKGTLRVANKQYNTTNHRYEIIFDKDALVEEVKDDAGIEAVKFNLVDLRSLEAKALPCSVDICGVITTFKASYSFTSRDGKDFVKRELTIVDDSATSLSVTLWGKKATQEDKLFEGQPVVAMKGVTLKEWNGGRNGSLQENSHMVFQPATPEAERVRQWWKNGGSSQPITALSQDIGGGSMAPKGKWADLSEVRQQVDQVTQQPEVFTVLCRASLVQLRKQGDQQPLTYMACQEQREGSTLACNRRVDETGFCPSCNRAGKAAPRLNLRVRFSDATDSTWLTTFHQGAEQLLCMPATEVHAMEKDGENGGREKLEALIRDRYFAKPLQATIRAKLDTYQGEVRSNVSCQDARPAPLGECGRRLLKEIEEMLTSPVQRAGA